MEEKILKFSTRVDEDLVCRMSDSAQPTHFLTRRYDYGAFKCFKCNEGGHYNYHLHCDICNLDFHKGCYIHTKCRMSDVSKPHTLQKYYGHISFCSACRQSRYKPSKTFYRCVTCNVEFHKGCHLYPPEIKHPFHPFHPLKLTFSSPNYSFSDLHHSVKLPSLWLKDISDSETEPDKSNDTSISDVKCKCCQKHLEDIYYHCSVCNYSLNLTCTKKLPALTITYLKSHDHPLTIFPRRLPLPCDACGFPLNKTEEYVYTCHPCDYMVHRTCIYLPRVIKITRHQHRLSLSSSLPSGLYICGVCRHPVNVTYGQFSCVKGCHYAVHSTCAVEGRVWDGKDLEGVPEDPDDEKDIEPFVRIDHETIDHFSHSHYLKFHNNNDVCDENRFCQACIHPIILCDSYYSCVQCDFLFHERCASLPRKKDHPLHRHPLILHPVSPQAMEYVRTKSGEMYVFSIEGMFKCNGCDNTRYGFVYKCSQKDCYFELDTMCASFPDPVIHESHPHHDLFFNLTQGECMGCKSSKCSPFSLECMDCKSFLGLKCASLPSVTYYKHDKHPLTLCYGEEDTRSASYWCEICEAKLDAKTWFYKCDDYCSVTVHISCLLGKETFMMKPLSFLQSTNCRFSILRNSNNTRPICYACGRRSIGEPFMFKEDSEYYCCLLCFFK